MKKAFLSIAVSLCIFTTSPFANAEMGQLPKNSTYAAPTETQAFKALFSKTQDTQSLFYTIKAKDNLQAVAKKNGTTAELLEKINGISSKSLRIGQKIKIPKQAWSVVIDKSQNTLILKSGEEVLKTFVVSTGKNNCTPVGVFKITDKLVNPVWYRNGKAIPFGSPENLLGTRWMGLTKKSYGIHGTTEPEKLGQQVSEGCIRMKNEEVEELYSYLPSGAEATIVD